MRWRSWRCYALCYSVCSRPWRVNSVLLEVLRCVLLCMLEAMEVLEVLEVPEVIRCALLCIVGAVEVLEELDEPEETG